MAKKRDDYYDKTPLEVLHQAMWTPHMMCSRRLLGRFGKPGEVIESYSGQAREALSRLKSDDVANVRPEEIRGWVGIVPQHLL